jgi:hypothetical protein
MDDAKMLFSLSLFTFSLLISVGAHASDVEYISPDQQKQLETQFKEARFSPTKDTKTLQSHEWTCSMYGVRSHLQVQRDLKLYKWSEEWHNDGAQIVSDYKASPEALIGLKDRFEDQVKVTKDGQLVSRLSLNTPEKTVLAYSVCKSL